MTAPLRNDVQSGAAEIARAAAGVMRSAAEKVTAHTVDELRNALAQAAVAVLEAQPAMARGPAPSG